MKIMSLIIHPHVVPFNFLRMRHGTFNTVRGQWRGRKVNNVQTENIKNYFHLLFSKEK